MHTVYNICLSIVRPCKEIKDQKYWSKDTHCSAAYRLPIAFSSNFKHTSAGGTNIEEVEEIIPKKF